MSPIRIVLADDHPSLRAGIRARFEKEKDMEIVGEAGTGAEALRLVTERKPLVVLLDLQMPDISGVEVARRLKEAAAPVRLLALSAHDNVEYVEEVLANGASGYLLKHEPLETIVEAVRGVAKGQEGWISRELVAKLMKHRQSQENLDGDPLQALSEREREVVIHIGRGKTNQQIADDLFISESTVKKHVNNIYFKLDMNSRAEAVAWVWRMGLIDAKEKA